MRYLTLPQVIVIHARLIQQTGGTSGIRDVGLLESALGRPQATFDGLDLYATLTEKAAALMESLCQSHAFLDGNKRVALVAAGIFLAQNGLRLNASNTEAYDFVMGVARGDAGYEDILIWLKAHTRPKEA